MKLFLKILLVSALVFAPVLSGIAGQPEAVPEGGYAIVVVPDSQKYVWQRPELYTLQTGWIAANVKAQRLAMLLHVGDVTQHNTQEQWELARRAHSVYSGLLPAVYVPGNHDLGPNGKTGSRYSLFSNYITLADYRSQPGFGGVYDGEPGRTENSWHLLDVGSGKWLILALEFAPRDDVLRWANQIVEAHPDRQVIMITHAYLWPDAVRFDRRIATPGKKRPDRGLDRYPLSSVPGNGGYNDAGDMWDKLVSKHPNFALVLCGHICTSAHLVSKGVHGNTVHEILVDYQDTPPYGGDGWLRLLQFMPDGKTVRVRDYSPLLNKTAEEPEYCFEFTIDPLASKQP